jgi:predicted nuclease of predicted toxin-antitoxin system
MRLLLDESVPEDLRFSFSGHHVETAGYKQWKSKSNGELLALARDDFDALVTVDQSIPRQQTLTDRDVAVVVLAARSNRIEDLRPLVSQVLEALRGLERGRVVRIEARYS